MESRHDVNKKKIRDWCIALGVRADMRADMTSFDKWKHQRDIGQAWPRVGLPQNNISEKRTSIRLEYPERAREPLNTVIVMVRSKAIANGISRFHAGQSRSTRRYNSIWCLIIVLCVLCVLSLGKAKLCRYGSGKPTWVWIRDSNSFPINIQLFVFYYIYSPCSC